MGLDTAIPGTPPEQCSLGEANRTIYSNPTQRIDPGVQLDALCNVSRAKRSDIVRVTNSPPDSGGREYCPFQGASRVEQTLRKAISRALAILMPRIAAGDVWEADCNLDRAERSNFDGDIDIRNAEGRAPIEIRFFYVNC